MQCETSYQKIFDNSTPNWNSTAWVQDFKTSVISYGNVLETYGRRASEFVRNGQLYKKLLAEKFDKQRRMDFQTEQLSRESEPGQKQWSPSVDGIIEYAELIHSVLQRTEPLEKTIDNTKTTESVNTTLAVQSDVQPATAKPQPSITMPIKAGGQEQSFNICLLYTSPSPRDS